MDVPADEQKRDPQPALVTPEQLAVLEKNGLAHHAVARMDCVVIIGMPVDKLVALLVDMRRVRKMLDLSHTAQSRINITMILEDLLEAGRVVMLSPDGEKGFNSSATPRRMCWSKTLEGAVEGLTDHPRVKVCIRERDACQARGRPQPLSDFPADSDSADGHASVCKECESKRVTRYQRAKKAKSEAGAKADYRPNDGKPEPRTSAYGPEGPV